MGPVDTEGKRTANKDNSKRKGPGASARKSRESVEHGQGESGRR